MVLRALIVEDQLMLQQLLCSMLGSHPRLEVVGSASTAAEAIATCAFLQPDLVILDMALPDGDGLQVAQALHVLQPSARAIILSSFASTVERPSELRSTIVAIIDKNRAFQDLLQEIESLLPSDLDQATEQPLDMNLLTSREQEVFHMIGSGQSSKVIATQLCLSVRTIETHRRNICNKFGLSGSALIHAATLHRHQTFGTPGSQLNAIAASKG
jgi:DNA-binding NarL/FixJ family response regulator